MEANETLHNVWPLPGLVDDIYICGGCCPVTEFCHMLNSLCILHVLHCPNGSFTAWQPSSGREPNFAALSTDHLYSAGQPSRWALVHILFFFCFSLDCCPCVVCVCYFAPGVVVKYCDAHVCLCVCLSVCPLGYLRNRMHDLCQFFCACCLWPWLFSSGRVTKSQVEWAVFGVFF